MRGVLVVIAALWLAAPAGAADLRVPLPDGTSLAAQLTSADGAPRPVLVEFTPYGPGTATFDPGDAYNRLLVQIRGTGGSDGEFDALGPRTQADVVETLRWACAQPWSDGRLALTGFSAGAITVYNALWQTLPCVKAAVLGSGTFELYRDLLYPGGISNLVPGAVVLLMIGAPASASGLDAIPQMAKIGMEVASHVTQDGFWRRRGFRGDANDLPILMVDGFFDVESRGAFEAFKALRSDGAHLLVIGAHEGTPADTDGGQAEKVAWLDRWVRGVRNGVEDHPRVQLWMADGDREALLAGRHVRYDAADWPVPGTAWRALALGAGSLGGDPGARAERSYPSVASLPTATDPPNAGIAGSFGLNALTTGFPPLGDPSVVEPLGLSFTTAPLARDWLAAGPGSLEVRLSSTVAETAIWAVVSDVSPDGVAHPVAAGRLLTGFPEVDVARSLVVDGDIVQPYGRFEHKAPAAPGEPRLYRVELWPIGNRFRAGHRIRLHLTGASAASAPTPPALNTVSVGAGSGSRLLLPELPAAAPQRHAGRLAAGVGRRVARRALRLRARRP